MMSSINPNETTKKSEWFSQCESIAEFYRTMNVPASLTTGFFGGKRNVWHISDSGQSFKVFCECGPRTLGYGVIGVKSRMASEFPETHWFKKSSEVDQTTGKITMTGPFDFNKIEVFLPRAQE